MTLNDPEMDSSTSIYPCVCFLPRWSKQCTVSAEFCQKWRCFHRADVWEWRHESYNVTWLRKNFNAKRCAKDRKSASQNVGFLSLIANPSAPINWQGGWHPPPLAVRGLILPVLVDLLKKTQFITSCFAHYSILVDLFIIDNFSDA